jgi:hypothetical protein
VPPDPTTCHHNEIPIYDRPWWRLFAKRNLWVCVRCDHIRANLPGSYANEGDDGFRRFPGTTLPKERDGAQ